MAGKIPKQFIDELVNRVDIVDVINTLLPLKKAGNSYKACCPFHDEKTPSFNVNRQKQFYHCFGCGAHGSAISFLMDYDHLTFVEAIEELAHKEGLDIPREAGDFQGVNHRPLYELMKQVALYYQQQLKQTQKSQIAIDYLTSRGLSQEVSSLYEIGYSTPGWDNLRQHFGQNAFKQLIEGGMISSNDAGKQYDRFRERIMFPIHDQRGRVIGFGGRILGDEKPKYLNSPETPLFHKGKELYGLYQAQKTNRQLNRLMVVEGYMDVIALAQFGITYTVATLGTATTDEHIQRLFRLVPEVIFCFDGDRAGKEAAWKALNITLKHLKDGRQAKFLFLPDGEDPDSIIRHEGQEAFNNRVSQSQALSDFLFEHLAKDIDINTLDGQSRLVSQAKEYIDQIQQGIFKKALLDKLSQFSGIQIPTPNTPRSRQTTRHQRGGASTPLSPVRLAIILLLKKPDIALHQGLATSWATLEVPGVSLLNSLIQHIQQHPNSGTGSLLEHWREQDDYAALNKLSIYHYKIPDTGILEEFLGSINRLEERYIEQRTEALLIKSNLSPLSIDEKNELTQLLTQTKH